MKREVTTYTIQLKSKKINKFDPNPDIGNKKHKGKSIYIDICIFPQYGAKNPDVISLAMSKRNDTFLNRVENVAEIGIFIDTIAVIKLRKQITGVSDRKISIKNGKKKRPKKQQYTVIKINDQK